MVTTSTLTAPEVPSAQRLSRRRPNHLPALTGLRFPAALLVVLLHYFHSLRQDAMAPHKSIMARLFDAVTTNGFVGVNVFFILSGFILVYTYLDDNRNLRGTRRAFYSARLSRIYPVYLVAWLAAAPWHGEAVSWPASSLATGLTSLTLTQAWVPGTAYYWNGPGWSLSAEAFFYLVFPILAIPLGRLSTNWLWLVAGGMWMLALAVGLLDTYVTLSTVASPGIWIFVAAGNPLARLPEFLGGIAIGHLFVRGAVSPAYPGRLATLAIGLVVGLLSLGSTIPHILLMHGLLDPLFALIILGLAHGRGHLAALFSLPAMVMLGEASYAVYILHEPLFAWLDRAVGVPRPSDPRCAPFVVIYLALVVAASLIIYRVFEVPARRVIRRALA